MNTSRKTHSLVGILVLLAICISCSKIDPGTTTDRGRTLPESDIPSDVTTNVACGTWICLPADRPLNASMLHPPHGPYINGAAVAADRRIFFAGGHEDDISYTSGVPLIYSYDIDTKTWSELPNLSESRWGLAGTSVGSEILFAGGIVAIGDKTQFYDEIDVYQIENATQRVLRLSQARSNMAAASSHRYAFFAGGRMSRDQISDRLDIYDATTGRMDSMTLPTPRAFASAVVHLGKLYIAGGRTDMSFQSGLSTMDILDIDTWSWETVVMPHPHPAASMAKIGEEIFIAGGDGRSNNNLDIYDTEKRRWRTEKLNDSRYHIAMGTLGTKLILLGGAFSPWLEIYETGEEGQWYRGRMNTGVDGVSAACLEDRCLFGGFWLVGNMHPNGVWEIRK